MKALYFENTLWKVAVLKAVQLLNRRASLGPLTPLRYAEVPEPAIPGPRWIKVRNIACGLCGTDIHFMLMDMAPKCFPAAMPGVPRKFLGHELVAEVVEVGPEVRAVAVGDRVAMRIDWPSCAQMEIEPPCAQCAAGNYLLCENFGAKDLPLLNTGGGFSPHMVMHERQAFKVLEVLDNDTALLLEPMASAVHGVLKAPPSPGDRVLVVGAGTIGLLTVAALRALAPEAAVYCLARHAFQARVAEGLGAAVIPEGPDLYPRLAETTGARYIKGPMGNEILLGGFDILYDTVGSDRSFSNALRWAKGGGTVVLVGINFQPGKVDYSPLWCQEVRVVGINCHATESDGRTSFDVASDILKGGGLHPNQIITHRFPVSQYREAIRMFLDKGASQSIKIVLDPNRT